MIIKRGFIYLAALDPVVGNEIAKTRPVAVISNDKNNEFSGTVTVVPITSKNLRKIYPFEVYLVLFIQIPSCLRMIYTVAIAGRITRSFNCRAATSTFLPNDER